MNKKISKPKNTQKFANQIAELMLEKKALDVEIIDVSKITTLTDYFIVCTSDSDPQTRAITDHINEQMKQLGYKSWHTEGYQNREWVLIDFVNVVVHIFSKEYRQYYEFERLWADGKITKVEDTH